MSTKFVDREKQKKEKQIANQICNARLLCPKDATERLAKRFEQCLIDREMWFEKDQRYPKVPVRLITKYAKEIQVGKDCLSMTNDCQYDITPFYPLLTFP